MASIPHYHEFALRFLELSEYKEDLLFVRALDSFFVYENGHYTFISDKDFHERVFQFLFSNFPEFNHSLSRIQEISQQIKWCCKRKIQEIGAPLIAFDDVLFDIEKGSILDHSRDIPAILHLPYKFEDICKSSLDDAPNFKKYLETTFINEEDGSPDLEIIPFIQEMMGYYLIPNLNGGFVFFFVGGGANGKSVLSDVIGSLIGEKFLTHMSIETLTLDKFSCSHLVGKYLNICNEEESKFMRSDKFKALVTGDPTTVEKKFGDKFELRPNVKFLFCSNLMPSFENINYGLIRRVKILPFFRRFAQEERDMGLLKKLREELPAIINFALEGAKRFIDRGYYFVDPPSIKHAADEFECMSSSVVYYARDFLEQAKDVYESTENQVLYLAYRTWCDAKGRKAVNEANFGRELGVAFPDSKIVVGKDANRKSIRKRNVIFKDHALNTSIPLYDLAPGSREVESVSTDPF